MAGELLSGLNPKTKAAKPKSTLSTRLKKSAWELKQWWDDKTPEGAEPRKRKIAIWPFWREESVVSEDFAEMLSDSLLAELVRGKDQGDEYVAREDLKIVTQEIDDFNQLRQSSEKLGKLMRNAGADVLIIGETKPESNGRTVYVRYRATNVSTGGIAATTDWYRLEYDFDRTPTMGIADAIKRSAAHFRMQLPTMRTIRPQGVRYGDSGIQTPFGKWFSARIIGELRKARGTAGQTINVADAVISERKAKTRGLKLAQKSADREMTATPTDDYILSGRYWVLGEKVDVQLTLRDGSDNILTWQGDVRASSIDLSLEPDETYQNERDGDRLGPISLRIRSNRGANPIYRTGQKMVLFIEAGRDSYLYCFYRQADGAIMRVFPNQFHRNAFVAGGRDLHIPGPSMRFDWIVEPPTGIEIMKCFAFDRDIADELPRLVQKLDFKPLPYRSLADLSRDLRTIPRAGIAENSMVVNVEE
ncbi:MAG: DUF4384 domain-containing protein [Rhodospirillaceae bacterium]|nr:DUF4384 domain-containing protein [Rhodospirillaceae bacterium]